MAICTEIRVELTREERSEYERSEVKDQSRLAAEASRKIDIVGSLLHKHSDESVLVIGQYLDQMRQIAELSQAPLITGKMASRERDKLYQQFRQGEIRTLIVFKAAKSTIDIPDTSVVIQISGSFGCREEETQRLVRILNTKSEGGQAHLYSVVTRDTKEQDYASQRQRLLIEMGCSYTVMDEAVIEESHGDTAFQDADAASLPSMKQASSAWKALLPTLQAQASTEPAAGSQKSSSNLLSLDDFRTKKRNRR